MKVAFYAPLKDPHHPVPSGDRTMAQGLIQALELGGHHVDLTSELRVFDKMGEPDIQDALFRAAADESARLLADVRAQTWSAWVTYHNYYKAPDLIGPVVARILNIPYFQIESTRAKKRLNGPWSQFAIAAEAACDAAHTVFYLTERDAEALRRDAPESQKLVHLRPFLAQPDLSPDSTRDGAMLAVGMMRHGDKLASYALIAETLGQLTGDWQLDIAGDGAARPEVEAMMSRFGDRVRFLGLQDNAALTQLYSKASLLFWPGVNEAFGLVYLEAQAAGVPVVAQMRPGVSDVVHSDLLDIQGGPKAMSARLTQLLADDAERNAAGQAARQAIVENHLLGAAAKTLTDAIQAAK